MPFTALYTLKKPDFLNKQIRFIAAFPKKLLVGFILCVYLCFFVIVLEPFDTSQFEDENKTALMAGYGIMTFVVYAIYSPLENIWYFKKNKFWCVKEEILTSLLFCLMAGSVLYLYNRLVVNSTSCDLFTYWRFLRITVLCMLPVFVPPMLYLRQTFGEKIVPIQQNSFVVSGENKNEILNLEKDELLFIRAVENYVEICFVGKNKEVLSKTFRQTLSNMSAQLPFLERCHRSYLVNLGRVKEIEGNSQAAKIILGFAGKEIPLSKTYYKQIKNKVA